jgi:hypothetical protein
MFLKQFFFTFVLSISTNFAAQAMFYPWHEVDADEQLAQADSLPYCDAFGYDAEKLIIFHLFSPYSFDHLSDEEKEAQVKNVLALIKSNAFCDESQQTMIRLLLPQAIKQKLNRASLDEALKAFKKQYSSYKTRERRTFEKELSLALEKMRAAWQASRNSLFCLTLGITAYLVFMYAESLESKFDCTIVCYGKFRTQTFATNIPLSKTLSPNCNQTLLNTTALNNGFNPEDCRLSALDVARVLPYIGSFFIPLLLLGMYNETNHLKYIEVIIMPLSVGALLLCSGYLI